MRTAELNSLAPLLLTPLLAASATHAQWSDDPTVNTRISGTMTNCVITHSAAAPDGGTWTAWYDASAGYDIVVQKLDATGTPVFPTPILVQDQSLSWVQDFDLAPVGVHCALAWADGTVTGAALVKADGTIAWQHDLHDGSGYQSNARVCGTNDDFTIVGWTDEQVSKLQRIGTDGTLIWNEPVVIEGSGYFLMSDLVASSDHDVIASMVHYLSFNGAKTLKGQRVRADGSLAWTSPAIDVFTQGSLQYGNFPSFIADDAAGAVFTWYSSSNLQSYIQWIDSDGAKLLGTHGALIASSSSMLHTGPAACFDHEQGEVTAFCTRQSSNQAQDGIQANRFDRDGTALWGVGGVQVEPMSGSFSVLDLQAQQLGPLATVFWLKHTVVGQSTVHAAACRENGSFHWDTISVALGEPMIMRSDLSTATISDTDMAAVWSDARDGSNRVYAQNINSDGSLGDTGCPADISLDGMVDVNDVLALIGAWGAAGGLADVNQDGVVDTVDLLLVLAAWGPCP